MTVDLLGVRRGAPVSALYTYLIGTLPENHMGVKARVPNVEKTQQVGGFTVMHREDMRALAPRWLHWTEEVRNDPDSWANTGDIYNDNGKYGPPWISEDVRIRLRRRRGGHRVSGARRFHVVPGVHATS